MHLLTLDTELLFFLRVRRTDSVMSEMWQLSGFDHVSKIDFYRNTIRPRKGFPLSSFLGFATKQMAKFVLFYTNLSFLEQYFFLWTDC